MLERYLLVTGSIVSLNIPAQITIVLNRFTFLTVYLKKLWIFAYRCGVFQNMKQFEMNNTVDIFAPNGH